MDAFQILLIEDSPSDARMFRELLHEEPAARRCEVTSIARLGELPTVLERGRFDLLILDLMLPDSSGLDTLRRARVQVPDIPILVVTGMNDEENALDALREGAQDYLVKGQSDGSALFRAIRHAVGRSRLDRERAALADELRFLARAGELLGSDLDYESTLREVARLSVPTIADWCVLDILDENGSVQSVQLAAADPAKERRLGTMLSRFPHASGPSTHPVQRVLDSHGPILVTEMTPAFVASSIENDDHLRMMTELAPVSAMYLPLSVHDEVLGALTLVSAESGRHFTSHDLWLAGELARRAALAIENARLYKHARAATQAREEVLAVVAHELRNPLSAITMIGTLLVEDYLSPEQTREQIVAMLRSAEQMDHLIADLLDIARIDAGTLAVDPAPVCLDEIVRDAIREIEPAARERRVSLETELQAGLPMAWMDASRILQVLSNLLGNSIRHTPPGTTVIVRVRRLGREILVSVSDDGSGIQPEHMPHLFDRFWQARPRAHAGAGLGLNIARGIVEAHRGRIWATSDPGQGATFFFTIPIAEERDQDSSPDGVHASLAAAADAEPMDNPLIRVFLVDDHPAVRFGVRSILARANDIELVGETGTGEEAVALVQRLRPDIVLMDLSLPGLSGLEAMRLLLNLRPETRVIALTADTEEDSALAVLEAGGHGFVPKTTAHEELITAIRSVARDEVFLHSSGNRILLDTMRRAARVHDDDPLAALTEHERQILLLAAEGYTAAEIGKKIFLSPSTVASYRSHAMRMLGLRDRASLVRLILDRGLLSSA
jgi:DNA-binding NarL/FixJ family response regulator/signal transduction histidine kinase